MIIVRISCGLGNQLFQYAAGRALSLRQQQEKNRNVKLKLDISNYLASNDINTSRQYNLGHFNIIEDIAGPDEIYRLKYPKGVISQYYKMIRAKLKLFNIGFIPRILRKKKDIYLDGFWQTEKYFMDFADQIRAELTPKTPMGINAEQFSIKIKDSPSATSLHIRRGDYVADKNANTFWGTCSTEYYMNALSFLASKIGTNMHVFIFSDEIEWAKNNITTPYATTYVSSPNIPDYEEIILMSKCKHNIISNSTFGWWGAWLNRNPDKIVLAPKRWAKKGNFIFRNIIPHSWIRI